jgi:hypothetical protein
MKATSGLILCLLAVLAVSVRGETINDFEGGYFKIISKPAGVYELDVQIAATDDGSIVAAYGDINNDS